MTLPPVSLAAPQAENEPCVFSSVEGVAACGAHRVPLWHVQGVGWRCSLGGVVFPWGTKFGTPVAPAVPDHAGLVKALQLHADHCCCHFPQTDPDSGFCIRPQCVGLAIRQHMAASPSPDATRGRAAQEDKWAEEVEAHRATREQLEATENQCADHQRGENAALNRIEALEKQLLTAESRGRAAQQAEGCICPQDGATCWSCAGKQSAYCKGHADGRAAGLREAADIVRDDNGVSYPMEIVEQLRALASEADQ